MHRTFPYMNLKVSVFYVRFLTVRNSLNPKKLFRDYFVMWNKKNYTGSKSFVQLCAKRAELVNSWVSWIWLSQIKSAFVENKRILKMLELFVDIEIAVQFMIFITLETRDKTSSKIAKSLVSISSMGGKKR